MTEELKGKTILIGRDPGYDRLLVAVRVNGQPGLAYMGSPGSVPNSVSRCKPADDTAHCKIEIDSTGNMIITNLKPQNVTCVNGSEIVAKRITCDDELHLGRDMYPIRIGAILDTATKIAGTAPEQRQNVPPTQSSKKSYSIKPLENVWKNYYDKTRELNTKQRNINLLRSSTPIFTLGSGVLAALAKRLDCLPSWVLVLTSILSVTGLILMIYSFIRAYKFNSIEEKELITQEFQKNYVCPNPECRHFLGNQPYDIVRQNKVCPYCRCKLTED